MYIYIPCRRNIITCSCRQGGDYSGGNEASGPYGVSGDGGGGGGWGAAEAGAVPAVPAVQVLRRRHVRVDAVLLRHRLPAPQQALRRLRLRPQDLQLQFLLLLIRTKKKKNKQTNYILLFAVLNCIIRSS